MNQPPLVSGVLGYFVVLPVASMAERGGSWVYRGVYAQSPNNGWVGHKGQASGEAEAQLCLLIFTKLHQRTETEFYHLENGGITVSSS